MTKRFYHFICLDSKCTEGITNLRSAERMPSDITGRECGGGGSGGVEVVSKVLGKQGSNG